jgi:hypothetical protein
VLLQGAAVRRDLDFYPSRHWAMETLSRRIPIRDIAEPCVGTGDLIRGRSDVRWTNDVDPRHDAMFRLDASSPAAWSEFPPVPWVVTNPPFNVAHQILACALAHASEGVAFLLRLSFLEPADSRGEFLARHPPTRLIVLPRISFTGDGKTDSVTCAWMVWKVAYWAAIDPGVEVASKMERGVGAREQECMPWR